MFDLRYGGVGAGGVSGGGVQNPVKDSVKNRNNPNPVPKTGVDIAHASAQSDAPTVGSSAYKAAKQAAMARVMQGKRAAARRAAPDIASAARHGPSGSDYSTAKAGVASRLIGKFGSQKTAAAMGIGQKKPKTDTVPKGILRAGGKSDTMDKMGSFKYNKAKSAVLSRVTQAKKTAAGR